MLDIVFSVKAVRQLAAIDKPMQRLIRSKIERLAAEPKALANQVRPLRGMDGVSRLRVGDYRVLFTREGLILAVLAVGHRRDIYE